MSCTNPQAPLPPLTVTRGESKTYLMTVRSKTTKLPVDLTGAKVWFSVKNRLEDPDPLINKRTLNAGGLDTQALVLTQSGATLGQAQIFLTPPDTAARDPQGSYVCDAWVELSSGKRYQVVKNRGFEVDPAVTTKF